jgi:hypothetical protein
MDSKVDFAKMRREAVHALTDLNEAVNAKYGIMAWERFDYDLNAGTLTFSHKGKARVVADIQVIGATGDSFVWAWANASWWPAAILEDALRVKAWGEEHGVAELTTPAMKSGNITELGWALTAVAAKITGAEGAYRPMDGTKSLFLLYRNIRFVD